MNAALRRSDGIEAAITVNLSKPTSGILIIGALIKVEGLSTIMRAYPEAILLGGASLKHPLDYALICYGDQLLDPNKTYTEFKLVHCNWPGPRSQMGYSDPEGMAMDNLKTRRTLLLAALEQEKGA